MTYRDLRYSGQLWCAFEMILEKPDDTPQVRETKRDLKWRLCVWEDFTLQFHGAEEELDSERTGLFDAILLEARTVCPNWEELDQAGIERGRALEERDLRRERERRAANAKALESGSRRWREREERARLHAAQDEEDEEFRNNFNSVAVSTNEPSHIPRHAIRAAMIKTEKTFSPDSNCAICLTNEQKRTIELKCGHLYHKSCAKKWLKTKLSCPLCCFDCQ